MFTVKYLPTGDVLHADSEVGAFEAVGLLCQWNHLDFDLVIPDYWYLLHDFPEGCTAVFADFCICQGGDYSAPLSPSSQH